SKVFLMFLLVLLCIGLIGFFSVSGSKGWFFGGVSDDSTAIRVVKSSVTVKELRDALTAMGNQAAQSGGGPEDPSAIYDMYGKEVQDGLIRQKLVLYEAEQLGLAATDAEVIDWLRQRFRGYEDYRQRIPQGLTQEQFDDNVRASISEDKIRNFVTAAVQVSAAEVEDDYRRSNTKYNARWVDVRPDQLKDKVQVNDAELHAFFDQHKADFRINSDQRKARYIFIDQNKAGEAIQVPEEELKKDFDPERGVQQVRVSQIVLHVPKEPTSANKNAAAKPGAGAGSDNKNASAPKEQSQDDKVRAKADEIVGKAQSGDFAALARQYSEDA